MNTETSKLLSKLEAWSQAHREKRTAVVALSDDETGNYYIHYAGTAENIGKCVHEIMEEDLESAMAIYVAATLFAHKCFPQDFLDFTNASCARVAALREEGKSSDEIRNIMLNKKER